MTRIAEAGLVAVIRAESPEEAVRTVGALVEGGVRVVELTFTTPDVDTALREARNVHGDSVLIGAGTVRTIEQVELAYESGAQFLVAPNLREKVLEAMLSTGLPSIPGVFTPSEVAIALDAGADTVKLFPASSGGIGHLKALLGPFPELRVLPTGGIDLINLSTWLRAGAVAVGVGGELCSRALIKEGRWDTIAEHAREFARVVNEARGR